MDTTAADWYDQHAKAANPPVSSCSARSTRRCSTRSANVSMVPYIMVALVRRPRRCASRITPIHSAVVVLRGAMTSRTGSTRISAPPPGMLSSPAAMRRSSTSPVSSFEYSPMCSTSDGDSACRWMG